MLRENPCKKLVGTLKSRKIVSFLSPIAALGDSKFTLLREGKKSK